MSRQSKGSVTAVNPRAASEDLPPAGTAANYQREFEVVLESFRLGGHAGRLA